MAPTAEEMFRGYRQATYEVWQVQPFRLPGWVREKGEQPFRPALAACWSVTSERLAAGEAKPEPVDALELVCDALAAAAKALRLRPGRIEMEDAALADRLRQVLSGEGISVEVRGKLQVQEMVAEFQQRMADDDPRPPLLSGRGLTEKHVARFAAAARRFAVAAPWRWLTNDDLVEIEAPEAAPELRFIVVMGAGREEYGLLFFSGRDVWDRFRTEGPQSLEDDASFWSVVLEPPWDAPAADLDLWERARLPMTPDGRIPVPMVLSRSEARRPDAQKLAFFEGLLLALAETSEKEIDSGRWTRKVEPSTGKVSFRLSLPALLAPEEDDDSGAVGLGDQDRLFRDLHKLIARNKLESPEEINAAVAGLGGHIPHFAPETPAEEAEELVERALRGQGRRRIHLARQALELWPDCAEAYRLLAGATYDDEERLGLYRQAVAAGERALGPEAFQDHVGQFWGILETRPYMRARLDLAQTLVTAGRHTEAVEHYRDLLRLCPNDNLGARWELTPLLFELGLDDEVARLLDAYADDIAAAMPYSRALLAFRREGDSLGAARALKAAHKANRFVPRYLLHPERLPPHLPAHYQLGSDDEAVLYAVESGGAWEKTPGALDWLKRRTSLPATAAKKKKAAKGKKKRRR